MNLPLSSRILLAAMLAPAPAATPRYLSSRSLLLAFRAAAPVQQARLYVSSDRGRSWKPAPADFDHPACLRWRAPADGRYDFYLVLVNAAGRSADPPRPGSTPHATVIVDTTPPLLQVHQALPLPGPPPALDLTLSLIDEHLSRTPLRAFYRTRTDAAWRDGGPVRLAGDRFTWNLPQPCRAPFDLRLVATDRAGNRAVDDLPHLTVPPPPTPPPPQPAPPTSRPATRSPPGPPGNPAETLPPPRDPARRPPWPAASTPDPDPQVAHLRRLARRYARQGRLALATARLQDALARCPADPELLVDLGDLLFRTKHYEGARRRFQSAARLAPDHPGALEGLALLAATRNRYARARAYLQHLLRLRPDCGRFWLHYGDMQHKLGNTAAAIAAWQRALSAPQADQPLRAKARIRLRHFAPATRPAATPSDSPGISAGRTRRPP